jgi:hypothetical protein
MNHHESRLQQSCVKWFRLQYPRFKKLLFAVPNGGGRRYTEAKILIGEGVVPGVSDLILAVPKKEFHALFIEMKAGKNKLSEQQEDFKKEVEKHNYKHITCYSFDEFEREINFYLAQ